MNNNGRKKIFTNFREITAENIVSILTTAYTTFASNLVDIQYLYNYYKGIQPILGRVKKVRPEIKNMIVENHAYQIVQFKTGYLLEKPVQYVARKDSTDANGLIQYNDYLVFENKESKDKEIVNDRAICGVAYRLALPVKVGEVSDSPFHIYTIDPQKAFVVYSSDIGEEPLLGVIILTERVDNEDVVYLQAYTKDKFYKVNYNDSILVEEKSHSIGYIPLIEYPNNAERLGAFEVVLPLLDAINTIQSNRVDAIEQFIQAIMVFKNVDIDKQMLEDLKELGAISVSDSGEVKANVEYLQQELKQSEVQRLKDDMVEVVYKICGIPDNKGSGGGDTGVATIVRDGWTEAEARAQEDELSFKNSERQFIKLTLSYCKTLTYGKVNITSADIDIKFTRRNYENLTQKVNALVLMLQNGKIAPRLAFEICGLFADSEEAYKQSEEYLKSQAQAQGGDPNAKEK